MKPFAIMTTVRELRRIMALEDRKVIIYNMSIMFADYKLDKEKPIGFTDVYLWSKYQNSAFDYLITE